MEGTSGHLHSRRLSRVGGDGGLGGFFVFRPMIALRNHKEAIAEQHARRGVSVKARRSRDRGVRGLIPSGVAGRRGPRSWPEAVRTKARGFAFEGKRAKRFGRRENARALGHAARQPRIVAGVPSTERGSREPGTYGETGARHSFGWQKSVGRIARLPHREVARPRGARGR
jgi:hypothetical protein